MNALLRPPLVIVTSDNSHWDLSDLHRFGEVHQVAGSRSIYPDTVDEQMSVLGVYSYTIAKHFDPDRDHVALVGDPLAICGIVSQIFAMHLRVSVLKFDKQTKQYYQTWIKIPDIGAREHVKSHDKENPPEASGGLEVQAFIGASRKVTSS